MLCIISLTKFLQANKPLIWVHALERVDLSDPNRKQFIKLRQNLESFRFGPGFDSINFHSRQIVPIYKGKIESHLKKWLAHDKTKLENSEWVFSRLGVIDNDIMEIAEKVLSFDHG